MKHTAPFQDKPMIPPIGYRDKMKTHVENIVVDLTFEILQWKDSTFPPKQQAYRLLVKKGFQNDEFTWLTQLAVDYCDYVMFKLNTHGDKVIPVAVRKVTELYLARLIKKEGQWVTLLPGAQNHYQTLVKELPELERKISEHLSNCGNILGARKMNGQYQQYPPIGQPFLGTDGLTYVFDGQYVRPIQQQQPTTEQEWQAVQARRQQQAFYQPPQQQLGYQQPTQQWGPNPGSQAQYNPMVPHQRPGTGVPGTYSGYNPNVPQTQAGSGMGPYRGASTVNAPAQPTNPAPQNPQTNIYAQSGQRHLDLPAPAPQGAKVEPPVEPTPRPGTQPKKVESVTPQVADVLMRTHSGYECEYFAAQAGVDGVKVGPPIIFDPKLKKGVYELKSNMAVRGFKLIPHEDNNVDYDKHETSQFFTRVRESADEPNRKKTAAMLANIQREMFIQETLSDIEARVIEGNVTGSAGEIDLSKPYIFASATMGSPEPHLFMQNFKDLNPDITLEGRVVNFEYISDYNAILEDDLALEALKIRDCKDWLQLKEIMRSLVELDLPLNIWNYLNQLVTDFVNDVLHYRLNLDEITITSFDTDIEDLVAMLHKNYNIRNEFKTHVEELCRTRLYPHALDNDARYAYPDVTTAQLDKDSHLLESMDDAEEEEAADETVRVIISQLTDVTSLPIESSSIYIPLPEKDNQWASVKPVACTVTEKSFPELYNAIHDRVKGANYRASHILFITSDNELMYIKKTSSPEAYVISHKQ